jgi:terminase small subunit / prophage DNA-packing protein
MKDEEVIGMRKSNKAVSTETDSASGAELADFWGCTRRHVTRLANEGVAVRIGHNRYDLRASNRNYVDQLRKQAASRGGTDAANAHTRYKQAMAEMAEIELAKKRGETLAVSEVREVWSVFIRAVRRFAMSIPGEMMSLFPTQLDRRDKDVIEDAIRAKLEDLAALNPEAARAGLAKFCCQCGLPPRDEQTRKESTNENVHD